MMSNFNRPTFSGGIPVPNNGMQPGQMTGAGGALVPQNSMQMATQQNTMQQATSQMPRNSMNSMVAPGANNLTQKAFKRGGKVGGLRSMANKVKGKGQGGDSVLAHISPEEARFLKSHFGGNINPHTGLPQYGLFKKLFKKAAPILGAIAGGLLGGPGGAAAGGALGGGLSGGKKGIMRGGLMGLGLGVLGPMAGEGLGLSSGSMLGKGLMVGHPGLMSQLGLGGMMGQLGLGGAGGAAAATTGAAGRAGAMSQLASLGKPAMVAGKTAMGSGGGLQNLLLGTMIAGKLLGKDKPVKQAPENTLQQEMAQNKIQWGPEDQYKPSARTRRTRREAPPGYRWGQDPEWEYFQDEPEVEAGEARFKKGGHVKKKVKGYYEGGEGGQADTIPTKLPADSYIVDATTVSLEGDGNSKNGAHKIKKFVETKIRKGKNNFEKTGVTKELRSSRNIKARVSDGELYLSPKEVAAVGNGDHKKGVKKLEKYRKELRKHKGVKKFLPPKSKELTHYMR